LWQTMTFVGMTKRGTFGLFTVRQDHQNCSGLKQIQDRPHLRRGRQVYSYLKGPWERIK
jgi:hypothetical protein